jgi:hypothetical protein
LIPDTQIAHFIQSLIAFFEDKRSPNCGIVRALHQQAKRADLCTQHEADPRPSTFDRKEESHA